MSSALIQQGLRTQQQANVLQTTSVSEIAETIGMTEFYFTVSRKGVERLNFVAADGRILHTKVGEKVDRASLPTDTLARAKALMSQYVLYCGQTTTAEGEVVAWFSWGPEAQGRPTVKVSAASLLGTPVPVG